MVGTSNLGSWNGHWSDVLNTIYETVVPNFPVQKQFKNSGEKKEAGRFAFLNMSEDERSTAVPGHNITNKIRTSRIVKEYLQRSDIGLCWNTKATKSEVPEATATAKILKHQILKVLPFNFINFGVFGGLRLSKGSIYFNVNALNLEISMAHKSPCF